MDSRHVQRIKIVQDLYAFSFYKGSQLKIQPSPKTQDIIKKTDQINSLIIKHAPKYSIDKIAKIDLSILQLGIYELLFEKQPPKVIIDEAVELAKELGSNRSFAFINAVLGKIYEEKLNKNMTNFNKLEKQININFKNITLLEHVFVHRSFLNEHKNFRLSSNENLEFLGDSVLSLITSVYLFKNYPSLHEGDYTEIKSAIVKTESLAESASLLNLGDYMYLSRGEEKGNGRTNKNILADCFEALIAAIFLDQNFEKAYDFVITYLFSKKLELIINDKSYLSAKGRFQEYIQGKYKTIPQYKVIEEKGPEHERSFKIGVFFQNKRLGIGIAQSKKEAEEKAAKSAFENLKGI